MKKLISKVFILVAVAILMVPTVVSAWPKEEVTPQVAVRHSVIEISCKVEFDACVKKADELNQKIWETCDEIWAYNKDEPCPMSGGILKGNCYKILPVCKESLSKNEEILALLEWLLDCYKGGFEGRCWRA